MLEGLGEGVDRAKAEWFATKGKFCGLSKYIKFGPVMAYL